MPSRRKLQNQKSSYQEHAFHFKGAVFQYHKDSKRNIRECSMIQKIKIKASIIQNVHSLSVYMCIVYVHMNMHRHILYVYIHKMYVDIHSCMEGLQRNTWTQQ